MSRKLTFLLVAALLLLLALASVASAATVRGKVVHRNTGAASYVVAKRGGQMVAIHAATSPSPGRQVVVRAAKQADGSYVQRTIRTGDVSPRARIRGVVTYVDPNGAQLVVSSRGVSLVVHRGAGKSTGAVVAGAAVTVKCTVHGDGRIDARAIKVHGNPDGTVELEGHILAVDTDARTLTLSADDCEELDAEITVLVPAELDLSQFAVGDEVEVQATLNADGTYTAVSITKDGDEDCDELHGVVQAVDVQARTLTVTPGGRDQGRGCDAADVTVLVPDAIDIAQFSVDQRVRLQVTQNEDGTYTLVAVLPEYKELRGVVKTVDLDARTLTVTTERRDQGRGCDPVDVTVLVPSAIDIAQFSVDQQVELKVTRNADGTFTLVEVEQDGGGCGD